MAKFFLKTSERELLIANPVSYQHLHKHTDAKEIAVLCFNRKQCLPSDVKRSKIEDGGFLSYGLIKRGI